MHIKEELLDAPRGMPCKAMVLTDTESGLSVRDALHDPISESDILTCRKRLTRMLTTKVETSNYKNLFAE